MAFWERTGWFLAEFVPAGPVDLGVLVNPWMANGNWQFAFLNGDPPVLPVADALLRAGPTGPPPPAPEQLGAGLPELDGLARAVEAVDGYADLSPWPGDHLVEGVRVDGPLTRWVVQFELVNACHACQTGYRLRAEFAFDAGGAYQGMAAVGLCRTSSARAEVPGVRPCPEGRAPGPSEPMASSPTTTLP